MLYPSSFFIAKVPPVAARQRGRGGTRPAPQSRSLAPCNPVATLSKRWKIIFGRKAHQDGAGSTFPSSMRHFTLKTRPNILRCSTDSAYQCCILESRFQSIWRLKHGEEHKIQQAPYAIELLITLRINAIRPHIGHRINRLQGIGGCAIKPLVA